MLLNGVVKLSNGEYDVNIVHVSEVVSMYRLCQLMIINCNDTAVLKIVMDMYEQGCFQSVEAVRHSVEISTL